MTPLHLRIRDLRLEAGLSQEQLARAAGVRQATISTLETGKSRRADFDVLEAIARVLNVDPHQLFQTTAKRPKR